jgi:hypothetical protein
MSFSDPEVRDKTEPGGFGSSRRVIVDGLIALMPKGQQLPRRYFFRQEEDEEAVEEEREEEDEEEADDDDVEEVEARWMTCLCETILQVADWENNDGWAKLEQVVRVGSKMWNDRLLKYGGMSRHVFIVCIRSGLSSDMLTLDETETRVRLTASAASEHERMLSRFFLPKHETGEDIRNVRRCPSV